MKSLALSLALCALAGQASGAALPSPAKDTHIVLIGGGLAERSQYDGYFETLLHLRYPDRQLVVRNMGFPGDTPGFRPRAGRKTQWAFPGAENFHPEYKAHRGDGIEPSPDEWLTLCKADTILAFFGYNESFDGPDGVVNYAAELDAFISHTLSQKYNGSSAPQLVLVSPIAFEDLSATKDLPNGKAENANLALYTEAMRKVAEKRKVGFVDLFTPTRNPQLKPGTTLTTNGFLPTDDGDRFLAPILAEALYGPAGIPSKAKPEALRQAVVDKGWFWRNDYRIVNGVHVYGRRRAPYGVVNYPQEIEKIRQMTTNRDKAVWEMALGRTYDLKTADANTRKLDPVATNFPGKIVYKTGNDALSSFKMAPGFKIELFASEERFPNLSKPMQMSFDNKGRLWIATMPSYPGYRPGDALPDDKLLIYEDTNGDGKADKETVFADHLHLPIGFEFAPEGVYVAQEPNLMLLRDTDGDGKADKRELVLEGFDSHDSHHSINAFSADASGSVYMPEGTFLHTNVETAYGPERGLYAGVWRFNPRNQRLDRYSQVDFANPWGIAFDKWDQCFIADASPGQNWWGLPLSPKVPYSVQTGKTAEFAPKRSRPTSGAEFISSRHFPDELQGSYMVNNVIGFLGTTVWDIKEDGSGFSGKQRMDLISSNDPNFRPCDMEFAPDGSLYVLDWHNALIGHMQHSARDPNRDHDHGRIYRVTYPSRPLVKPVPVAGASVTQLLKDLEEPEYRTRYRARRELRGHKPEEVLPEVTKWVASLDKNSPEYDHRLCEALWTTWGFEKIDHDLLVRCLEAKSPQARAAAVDVIRFSFRYLPDHTALLMKAAVDPHPRVRLAAMVAASWLNNEDGAKIASEALERPLDSWMTKAYQACLITLKEDFESLAKNGKLDLASKPKTKDFLAGKLKLEAGPAEIAEPEPKLPPAELALYRLGKEVYQRDVHCSTCHQPNGMGDTTYPPLAKSEYVTGDETRLIKIVLKGVWGPITVHGKTYDPKNGVPPMTPFEALLKDDELAGVLTYVRNSFGNSAPAVKPETVAKVRAETKDKVGFYTVEELLKQHPF
ncbi:c-type cytochrome [Luteolibacter ambystomatis]|uniref:C-type cytochrome n=1 Tax=Luteolibacter ambystomatis TaxID=2824561 RepID=A0A975IZV0_9BACT|nr:PVC-type heme-binding CxxCH protein [Luteolibacter ambystomatis]QUE50295.1 c-type cytochrome [Luteolibacter ambystomatis]